MSRPLPRRPILLRSADGRDFVRLGALRSDAGYPSLEVRVDATARGFAGGTEAWIDGFALKEAVAALRALERSRQGRVELRSMTPDELRLVLRSTDRAGHLVVEFAISRGASAGDAPGASAAGDDPGTSAPAGRGPGTSAPGGVGPGTSAPAGGVPGPAPLRVSGAFALDPGTLGEVVGGFAQLAGALG